MKENPHLKVTDIAKMIAEKYHRLSVDETARLDEIGEQIDRQMDRWVGGWDGQKYVYNDRQMVGG